MVDHSNYYTNYYTFNNSIYRIFILKKIIIINLYNNILFQIITLPVKISMDYENDNPEYNCSY